MEMLPMLVPIFMLGFFGRMMFRDYKQSKVRRAQYEEKWNSLR